MATASTPGKVHGTQAIARAAQLLRQLATRPSDGCRLVDVAAALALQRPTAHRILQALAEEGLVEQDPATRAYRLGPLLHELSLSAASRQVADASSHHSVAELARLTGDTCFMIRHSGDDAVCVSRHEGYYPIKAMVLEVGQRRPMGVGAGSVAILAALPPQDCRALLARNERRLAAQSALHGAALAAVVQDARNKGYALKPSQAVPGVLSMGMAVLDEAGRPRHAISVSTLAPRLLPREREVAAMLRAVTRELARVTAPVTAPRSRSPGSR